jgi:pimeloyl-ACP methyl ester carboxylesterase
MEDHLPAGAHFQERKFTSREGFDLVGDVIDAGRPWVVMLHGGGQTRGSWRRSANALASRGFSVLTLDARGHGESGWSPKGDYTLTRLAEDLSDVVSGLDGPIHLIGASMGGWTAFQAAGTTLAHRVASLVLVDITLNPSASGSARVLDFMAANPEGFASVEEAAQAVARYNPARPRSASAEGLRRNLRIDGAGRYRWHWDPVVLDTGPQFGRDGFSETLDAASRGVKAPTLLVHGSQSDVVDQSGIEALRGLIPHLEVREVANASHMVAGDRNDQFLADVLPFLAAHARSDG